MSESNQEGATAAEQVDMRQGERPGMVKWIRMTALDMVRRACLNWPVRAADDNAGQLNQADGLPGGNTGFSKKLIAAQVALGIISDEGLEQLALEWWNKRPPIAPAVLNAVSAKSYVYSDEYPLSNLLFLEKHRIARAGKPYMRVNGSFHAGAEGVYRVMREMRVSYERLGKSLCLYKLSPQTAKLYEAWRGSDGHKNYIIAGGESNPGPPKVARRGGAAARPPVQGERGPQPGQARALAAVQGIANANEAIAAAEDAADEVLDDRPQRAAKQATSEWDKEKFQIVRADNIQRDIQYTETAEDVRARHSRVKGVAPTYKTKVSEAGKISCEYESDAFPLTAVYNRAVEVGFSNDDALTNFNEWVEANIRKINPVAARICNECGASKMTLCEHFITRAKATMLVDGQLAIPSGDNFCYEFRFVDRVRRIFAWPKFLPNAHVNRGLAFYHNRDILDKDADNLLMPKLLAHLRLKMNVDYTVDGTDRRNLRLQHCQKLAMSYFDRLGISEDERATPGFVNSALHTIQVACDNDENRMLLGHNSPSSWSFPTSQLPRALVMCTPVALTMLSPRARAAIYSALLRPLTSYLRRHLQVSTELLLSGSAHALRQAAILAIGIARLARQAIWTASGSLYLRQLARWFMETAATMYMKACTSDTLRKLLSTSMIRSIMGWLGGSLRI